jgi:hypothetical protein
MAPERLSRLQRRLLAWLAAEAQRTRGTISASHAAAVDRTAEGRNQVARLAASCE